MKNKFLILAALILVATTTIAIISCQKEKPVESVDSSKNLTKSALSSLELSEEDQAMIAFGEKMKAAVNVRESETMQLKEGLIAMSNYQNFSMCDASHFSSNMIIDTLIYSLYVTDGEVSLFNLNKLYESSKAEIQERFALINSNQKAIFCIWTSLSETMESDLDNYTGNVDVEVVTRMEESFFDPRLIDGFDSSDYWKDFGLLGKCGLYDGQCVGRDCVTELYDKLAVRWNPVMCPVGYRRYLTYIHDVTKQALNYPCTSSPNGFYAWPYRSGLDPTACVSPSEMWWYLYRIESDMDDLEDDYEQNIVSFTLDEIYKLPWKDGNHIWEAYMVFTLATVNCTLIVDN